MFIKFLTLQWKTTVRSPMWQKNLALNIVIGFFLLLFALYLLLLGLFIDKILEDLFPDRDNVEIFNSILIYYFLADLAIRFMMQSMPRLTIESFLHLPVKKSSLIHYLEGRTVFDFFNLIPLFIFIPVTFTMILPHGGAIQTFNWLASLMMLILANNFIAIYLKRLFGIKPLIIALVCGLLILLVFLDKMNILSISELSSGIFRLLSENIILLLLPLGWMVLAYILQYRFLAFHLYPDEMQVRKTMEIQHGERSIYLRSLGITGTIIALELKLYWRNKRTRTIIYLMPVFLLYGLMFYPNKMYMNQNGWLMFVGIFMTGGMMLNYANYAFGYESGYFDALLTKNINFYQYIRVKFYISVIIASSCYILSIPYLFFGVKILLINTAMFLYNIGILSYILLYFATYNKKRMDLTRGGAFNYQGIGAMNWLAILPAFLLPVLITIPFNLAGYPFSGIAFTGIIGITGILLSGKILKVISKNFYKRKYIMAASFREK